MAILKDQETLLMNSQRSDLSQKATREILMSGSTMVVCPNCNEKPLAKESYFTNGETSRIEIKCNCGYIYNNIIYF